MDNELSSIDSSGTGGILPSEFLAAAINIHRIDPLNIGDCY